jgi:hypothetical protein
MKRFVSQMTTLSFSPIASALYTPFPHYIHHSHTTGALLTVGMMVFWDMSFFRSDISRSYSNIAEDSSFLGCFAVSSGY